MSNSHITRPSWFYFPVLWLASCLACQQSSAQKGADAPPAAASAESSTKRAPYILPIELPEWDDSDGNPQLSGRSVTIIPQIQNQVTRFIRNGGTPIAAMVMVKVKTGEIIAMAQGAAPNKWGA
ncbi:MAG: hypothetical protein NTX25_23770, partial [Proteobacteria bacterium]|nr:hypothetical protein [Pseudomonadota bacterium]